MALTPKSHAMQVVAALRNTGHARMPFVPVMDRRDRALVGRLAAASLYVRLGQRTIQLAIFQLATAGVYLFAGECTDQAGPR